LTSSPGTAFSCRFAFLKLILKNPGFEAKITLRSPSLFVVVVGGLGCVYTGVAYDGVAGVKRKRQWPEVCYPWLNFGERDKTWAEFFNSRVGRMCMPCITKRPNFMLNTWFKKLLVVSY
jgi:hypothetical protein